MRPRWDGTSSTLLPVCPVVLGRRYVGLTTVYFLGAQVPSSSGSKGGSKDTGYVYAVNSHAAGPAHSSVLCTLSLDFNLSLPSALETSVAYFMFSECLVLFSKHLILFSYCIKYFFRNWDKMLNALGCLGG